MFKNLKKFILILISLLCLNNVKAGEEVIDTNSVTPADSKDVIIPDDPETPDAPYPWFTPLYVYNIPGNWSYPWLPTFYPAPRATPSPVSPF
jgi:hypothetical protein